MDYKSELVNSLGLLLFYRNESFYQPLALVQKAEAHDTYGLALSLIPLMTPEDAPKVDGVDEDPESQYHKDAELTSYRGEHLFLLDYSGSMSGRPLCLSGLCPLCFFRSSCCSGVRICFSSALNFAPWTRCSSLTEERAW